MRDHLRMLGMGRSCYQATEPAEMCVGMVLAETWWMLAATYGKVPADG